MTLLGRFLDVATLVSPGTLPAPESHIMLLGEPLVLVAEDDAILAFSIAEGLERSGFRVAGPFAKCNDATTWLNDHTPDGAVLDVRLADGTCADLARSLKGKKVPVVVLSGLMESDCESTIEYDLWMEKPLSDGDLAEVLREAIWQGGKPRLHLTQKNQVEA